MRIAIVDPSLFTLPYDGHLCNGLAANGAEVTLYGRHLRRGEQLKDSSFAFIPLFYHLSELMPVGGRATKPLRSVLKAVEHIFDSIHFLIIISRTKPDVIHYQWMPIPALDRYIVRKLKKKNIPVFFTVHDTSPFNESPTIKGQGVGWQSSLELFDALFVHTETSKQTLEQYGIPPEKIIIVSHGMLSFGPMEKSLTSQKTILFFGTIKPYKGIDILLKAFQKIANGRNILLNIIGSCQNDDIDRYRSLITTYNIADKVNLDVRYFADAEIPQMLSNATIVVFPYLRIDGSGALLTAITYEKPFIASDIGIFHEILQNNRFSLVPTNDASALAERLAEVLDNPEKLKDLEIISKNIKSNIPSWNDIGALTLTNYQKYIHAIQ